MGLRGSAPRRGMSAAARRVPTRSAPCIPHGLRAQVGLEARWRALMSQPEEGAATAEYAVVLVAATGFAAVLVALMKSDTVKTLLTNIVKKALNV